MAPVLEPIEHSVLEKSMDGGPMEGMPVLEPLEHSVLMMTLDGGPMEGAPVLEPIEHSVLEKSLDGGPMEGMPVLEPLEHSVLVMTLDGGPMEGAPVLEPLEHSVLEKTLDGGPMEGMTVLEPLEHSVLEITLDGELIKDLSVLEPLEHSVREMTLDGGPIEEMTVLEPLEHSVLDMALDGRHMEGMTVLEPLEYSVLQEARSDGPMVEMSVLEPLEHLVLDVAPVWGDCSLIRMTVSDPLEHSGLGVTVHVDMDSLRMAPWDAGGTLRRTYRHGMAIWRDVLCGVVRFSPMPVLPATGYLRSFGGLGRTFIMDLYAGEDALVMGAAVPLPAENIDRVVLSPMEVWFGTCDVTNDRDITAGLVSWNTEGDILDQCETFNGMPEYYVGDLYYSEDSDWDDPYAIAGDTYVEDYNFDVPKGMDLMVHRHRRAPHNSDIRQNWQMDRTPVCRTMPCDTRDEWDIS